MRKRRAIKRDVLPDPIYNSKVKKNQVGLENVKKFIEECETYFI